MMTKCTFLFKNQEVGQYVSSCLREGDIESVIDDRNQQIMEKLSLAAKAINHLTMVGKVIDLSVNTKNT